MILLSDTNPRTIIMTPPKCACTTLHSILGVPPFGGRTIVGPSVVNPAQLDFHVRTWPNEVTGFRRVVVVRHPLARLVSMYLHLARWDAAHGRATQAFWFYANQVARGENTDPLYAWNLCQWLDGVEADAVLKVEELETGLNALGLLVSRVPVRNSGFMAGRSFFDFYDKSILDVIHDWAAPDIERWGYTDLPPRVANAAG